MIPASMSACLRCWRHATQIIEQPPLPLREALGPRQRKSANRGTRGQRPPMILSSRATPALRAFSWSAEGASPVVGQALVQNLRYARNRADTLSRSDQDSVRFENIARVSDETEAPAR